MLAASLNAFFCASPIYGSAEDFTFLLDVTVSREVTPAAKQQIGETRKMCNSSSLFPPQAAVVAVALWQWQRNDYFLFAAEKSLRAFLCCFFTRGGVTSKCIKEHKCSLPVLPHSVKMCLERPAGRDKHKQ